MNIFTSQNPFLVICKPNTISQKMKALKMYILANCATLFLSICKTELKILTLITEKFENGVWEPLDQGLKATVNEIMQVETDITEDQIPNHELHMDVLLATDSSGSHKQFQGKDIDIDSRNINVGKDLFFRRV